MTSGRAGGYVKPPDWERIMARIIRRDNGVCHICRRSGATSVDHVVPVSQSGGHDDGNLAAVHPVPCHAVKTEAERRAGLAKRTRTRPTRPHPNLIRS